MTLKQFHFTPFHPQVFNLGGQLFVFIVTTSPLHWNSSGHWNLTSSLLSIDTALSKPTNGVLAIQSMGVFLLYEHLPLPWITFPLAAMTPHPSSGFFKFLGQSISASFIISHYSTHCLNLSPIYVSHKCLLTLPGWLQPAAHWALAHLYLIKIFLELWHVLPTQHLLDVSRTVKLWLNQSEPFSIPDVCLLHVEPQCRKKSPSKTWALLLIPWPPYIPLIRSDQFSS